MNIGTNCKGGRSVFIKNLFSLLLAILLSGTAVSAGEKPSKQDAIGCYERFMAYMEKEPDTDTRSLAASLVDVESVAEYAAKFQGISIETARTRVNKTMNKTRSSAFKDLDPETVTFLRSSRAISGPRAKRKKDGSWISRDWVFELVGQYKLLGAENVRGQTTPESFTFWLEVTRRGLCKIRDIEWNGARLSVYAGK